MKILRYILLASLTCALSACEKDEILPEPEPPVVTPGDDPGKDEEEKIRLGITASLQAMQTKGIIEAFLPGHEMGVFISTTDTGSPYVYNVPYAFDGKKWNAGGDAPVEGDSEVAAYLPYNGQASGDRLIPFELADQHDILYGRATVTRDIPTADIEMKHAMSLVRIKILKNEYMGEGIVSNIRFDNVITRMTLDIRRETNSPLIFDFSSRGSLQAGGNYHLNDADPVVVETILPPVYGYDQKATVCFTIDGKEYPYEFHRDHEWEAGMKYTYTLKMTGNYNSPVNMEQVDIDVEYWSRYGKTDQIILNPNPEDYPFKVWPNYTEYGYDCYQNEGKVFGTFYNPYCDNGEGELRFVFMRPGTNEVVEQFQPIDIKTNGAWDGKRIQCYVTSAPGTYQLVPLFRKKGETMWCRAVGYSYGSTDEEWLYEVKAPASDNLPALRMMEVEGQGYTSILAYPVPDDDPWNLVYTLSNRGEKALRGEIKAVWEREFKLKSNSYSPSTKKKGAVNDEEWKDEIGKDSVDIPTGTRFWKGIMSCKFPVKRLAPRHDGVKYAIPVLHLYWRAENSNEWILLRCDADYLFNCNYTGDYIWDETTNYVKVMPQSWH